MSKHGAHEVCSVLARCLRERLPELETAVANRVYAISDPREVADPSYLFSLHGALTTALDYAIDGVELGERRAAAVPPALLAEARLAARVGVTLDALLRRYLACNALLSDLLIEEAERASVSSSVLSGLLRRQSSLFDQLLEATSEEHVREAGRWPSSPAERRRENVKSLLAGEQVDHSELGYDIEAHHLALMIRGEQAPEVMRALAQRLDRRLLAVCREEEPVWACWLGGRSRLDTERALDALGEAFLGNAIATIGEPGEGLAGWRLSHRQAKAALPIAERRRQPILRYADVSLLASIARDDLAAASLHQLYLGPLENERDGGLVARETLRAYFAADRNTSSTASALGVDRHTVRNRIRAIEDLYGRPLKDLATALETALQLDA